MTKIDNDKYEDRISVIDDEKKRVIDLYSLNLVPPFGVGIFDEPTRCYRINLEWAKLIMGAVSAQLVTVASWRDADEDDYQAIQEVLKFLVGGNCMTFSLRQSPDNNCIMQQTLDGVVWTDIFDFSLCETIQDQSNSVNIQNAVTYVQPTVQNIYNEFVANYITTPSDVHPQLEYTGDNLAELNAAYCNAVFTLVSVLSDNTIEYYKDLDANQNELNVGIAIAVAVLGVIALAGAIPTAGASLTALAPLAALWGVSIGVAAAIGNALYDAYQLHTIDQFQDANAREEVACYIIENLSGEDNNHASMIATVQAHSLTGNASAIADVLAILIEIPSTYAAFLEKWQNNLEYAEAGIELYCPCEQHTSSPMIAMENCAGTPFGTLEWRHDDVWRITSELDTTSTTAQIERAGGGKFRITSQVLISGVRTPPYRLARLFSGGACFSTTDGSPDPGAADMLHYGWSDEFTTPFVIEITFVDID